MNNDTKFEKKPTDNDVCGWKCGDEKPNHGHFTVIARENGKLLGRLTPEGTATKRCIHAAILSKSRATEIADEINRAGKFQASVARF